MFGGVDEPHASCIMVHFFKFCFLIVSCCESLKWWRGFSTDFLPLFMFYTFPKFHIYSFIPKHKIFTLSLSRHMVQERLILPMFERVATVCSDLTWALWRLKSLFVQRHVQINNKNIFKPTLSWPIESSHKRTVTKRSHQDCFLTCIQINLVQWKTFCWILGYGNYW